MIYYLVTDIDKDCSPTEKYKVTKSNRYLLESKYDIIIQMVRINKHLDSSDCEWSSWTKIESLLKNDN